MEHEDDAGHALEQRDLFSLLPGVMGGRALARTRGSEHMRAIGRLGGAATRDRYGVAYLQALGRLGRDAWRDYRRGRVRVIAFSPDERERLVPYLPAHSRRRRPILVRISVTEEA